MEPEPWIPSAGLFDNKVTCGYGWNAGGLKGHDHVSKMAIFLEFLFHVKKQKWFLIEYIDLNQAANNVSQRQPCIPVDKQDEICGQKGFEDVCLGARWRNR